MQKKIAVLVRERQDEALRMSLGLILADDAVDIYVLDRKLHRTEDNALHLETIKDMEMKMYTNCAENEGMEYLSSAQIAQSLPQYDCVLPY